MLHRGKCRQFLCELIGRDLAQPHEHEFFRAVELNLQFFKLYADSAAGRAIR